MSEAPTLDTPQLYDDMPPLIDAQEDQCCAKKCCGDVKQCDVKQCCGDAKQCDVKQCCGDAKQCDAKDDTEEDPASHDMPDYGATFETIFKMLGSGSNFLPTNLNNAEPSITGIAERISQIMSEQKTTQHTNERYNYPAGDEVIDRILRHLGRYDEWLGMCESANFFDLKQLNDDIKLYVQQEIAQLALKQYNIEKGMNTGTSNTTGDEDEDEYESNEEEDEDEDEDVEEDDDEEDEDESNEEKDEDESNEEDDDEDEDDDESNEEEVFTRMELLAALDVLTDAGKRIDKLVEKVNDEDDDGDDDSDSTGSILSYFSSFIDPAIVSDPVIKSLMAILTGLFLYRFLV